MSDVITATLRSGVVVSGKLYKNEAFAKTFANRTQAYKEQEKLGASWAVYHPVMSRVWYVAKRDTIPGLVGE